MALRFTSANSCGPIGMTPAKEVAQRFGVTMKDLYWTAGEYDMLCVLEGKDELSITAFSLAIAQQGNVRSKSLRAFNAAEMDQVLAKLR